MRRCEGGKEVGREVVRVVLKLKVDGKLIDYEKLRCVLLNLDSPPRLDLLCANQIRKCSRKTSARLEIADIGG